VHIALALLLGKGYLIVDNLYLLFIFYCRNIHCSLRNDLQGYINFGLPKLAPFLVLLCCCLELDSPKFSKWVKTELQLKLGQTWAEAERATRTLIVGSPPFFRTACAPALTNVLHAAKAQVHDLTPWKRGIIWEQQQLVCVSLHNCCSLNPISFNFISLSFGLGYLHFFCPTFMGRSTLALLYDKISSRNPDAQGRPLQIMLNSSYTMANNLNKIPVLANDNASWQVFLIYILFSIYFYLHSLTPMHLPASARVRTCAQTQECVSVRMTKNWGQWFCAAISQCCCFAAAVSNRQSTIAIRRARSTSCGSEPERQEPEPQRERGSLSPPLS